MCLFEGGHLLTFFLPLANLEVICINNVFRAIFARKVQGSVVQSQISTNPGLSLLVNC